MIEMFSEDEDIKYHNSDSLSVHDLSGQQRKLLLKLNAQLIELEEGMRAEVLRLRETGQSKIKDPNDFIEDFEIEWVVSFWLRKDDPDHIENKDNILVELRDGFHRGNTGVSWPIGDGQNHNDFQHRDHPMSQEHHCWLYHCLYDHTDLGWANILRIGYVWLDIDMTLQKAIRITESES